VVGAGAGVGLGWQVRKYGVAQIGNVPLLQNAQPEFFVQYVVSGARV
jgi:hypothetical protein